MVYPHRNIITPILVLNIFFLFFFSLPLENFLGFLFRK